MALIENVSDCVSVLYTIPSVGLDINAPRQYKILSLRYTIRLGKDNTFFIVPGTLKTVQNWLK